MKFVLILTLFGFEAPEFVYAIVTNISAVECQSALSKHQMLLEQTFQAADFVLTCEMDDQHED